MATLVVGGVSFDADAVAFDKDGTLLDFDVMWGRLAEAWVEQLLSDTSVSACGTAESAPLMEELYRALGYDPQAHRTRPDSPLAIASTAQLQTIASATLYHRGVSWPEAEERVRRAFTQAAVDHPSAGLVRAAGNVRGLFDRLRRCGAKIAVVTTDDRRGTEESLLMLGVRQLVDIIVCGDDGLAVKPAPDMLLHACSRLGVAVAGCAVVGDTTGDLLMAERAGAGCRIGVLSGAGDPDALRAHADAVIPSIDHIAVKDMAD